MISTPVVSDARRADYRYSKAIKSRAAPILKQGLRSFLFPHPPLNPPITKADKTQVRTLTGQIVLFEERGTETDACVFLSLVKSS